METNEMTLGQKLSKIQQEFKSKKSRFNSFGKYNFRSAEDILEALKPINEKYDVYFIITEELIAPAVLKTSAIIFDAEKGCSITSDAIVGVDLDQKGMQMPQRFGSASSYGKKYALGNLLLIDDTADSDATNTHGKSESKKPELTGVALTKAIKYVKDGGDIKAIRSKYSISAANLKKLQ